MPKHHRRTIALLCCALASVLGWYWLKDTSREDPVSLEGVAVSAARITVKSNAKILPAQPEASSLKETVAAVDTITQFQQLNRYLSGTQAIDDRQTDLVSPGSRHERKRSLATNGVGVPSGWEMLLTADRYFITGDETAEITLDLWWNDSPVRLGTLMLRAQASDELGVIREQWLTFGYRDAQAFAQFTPDERWSDLSGPVRVMAEFTSPGLERQSAALDFYFTGSDRIPGEFMAVQSDAVIDGNLVFEVMLDIRTAGEFRFSANILDQQGRVFGHVRDRRYLDVGSQLTQLRFDGLLFHDAAAVAPFYLTTLRGERLNPLSITGRDRMPSPDIRYQSAAYDRDEFREYVARSPRRDQMIERYQTALARGLKLTPGE